MEDWIYANYSWLSWALIILLLVIFYPLANNEKSSWRPNKGKVIFTVIVGALVLFIKYLVESMTWGY